MIVELTPEKQRKQKTCPYPIACDQLSALADQKYPRLASLEMLFHFISAMLKPRISLTILQ